MRGAWKVCSKIKIDTDAYCLGQQKNKQQNTPDKDNDSDSDNDNEEEEFVVREFHMDTLKCTLQLKLFIIKIKSNSKAACRPRWKICLY